MCYSFRVPFRFGQKVWRLIRTGGIGTRSYTVVDGWTVEGFKIEEDNCLRVMCYRDNGGQRRHEYINAASLYATKDEAVKAGEGEEE